MLTNRGETIAIRDHTVQLNILKSKYEKAEKISQETFCMEWDRAMAVLIDFISQRFSTLIPGNQPVVVYPRVNQESRGKIKNQVKRIDTQ